MPDASASSGATPRQWAADPEVAEDKVRASTGRSWDQWCDLIEAWPGGDQGHTAIATFLRDKHGVDAWWAQTITVGYERIVGLRMPHQRPDGTFTVTKSATIDVDAGALRRLLVDGEARRELFPSMETELRSKESAKTIRLAVGPGVALIAIEPKSSGLVGVTVAHERLPEFEDVERWKTFWSDWLRALDKGHAGSDADQPPAD